MSNDLVDPPTVVPTSSASPNETVVFAGSSGTIEDSAGDLWTITAGGQVAFNGTALSGTANVTELAYVNGTVWQENASNNWYSIIDNGGTFSAGVGPTTASPVMATMSPDDTVVLAGSSVEYSAALIDDSAGNLWAITADGQVAFNGVPISGTANVTKLAYVNGTIWQENASNNWYSIVDNGGTFSAGVGPTKISPIPISTITLTPTGLALQAGQDFGDSFILSAASAPQHAELDFFGSDTAGRLSVSGNPSNGTSGVGTVFQAAGVNLDVRGGVHISDGLLQDFIQDGGTLSLEGTSTINNGGIYSPSVSDDNGTLLLNGTIDVGALAHNTLNLADINVVGGVIAESGENDVVQLGGNPASYQDGSGTVTNTVFEITGGVMSFLQPNGFNGIIGPATSNPDAPSIGIFGEVQIFNAQDVAQASFDTSTGMLSLLNGAGNDVGDIRFAGDASGLRLNMEPGIAGYHGGSPFLAINDQGSSGNGAGGNIPLTFHA